MKAKHKRLLFILGSLLVMALAATAILYSFRDNLVFFYTPSQLAIKQAEPNFKAGHSLRIGGLVKAGSITNLPEGGIHFTITDLSADLPVTYRGLVPSLFREGQGVVAQGSLTEDGKAMKAETILAKHDEKYMPRDVVDALKASGQWKEGEAYSKGKQP